MQVSAEEIEVLPHESGGKIGRAIVRRVPPQVRLPLGQGARLELVLHFREKRGLGDVDHALQREPAGFPVFRPVERGRQRGQVGAGHFVELLIRVAEFHLCQRRFGERRFDLHDGLRFGLGGGGRIAQQFEHVRHMLQVFGARLFALGVGLGVVIAIRKPQTAGRRESDHSFGVGEILVGAESEDRVAARRLQVDARQHWRQVLQGGDARDGVQRGSKRRRASLFHGSLVHAGAEEIADLLLVRRAPGRGFGGLLQYAPQELLILLRQLAVDVPARLVGRNRIQPVPVAAGVAPEIDARVHGAFDEGGFQAGGVGQRGERAILRAQGRRNQRHGE